MNDIESKRIINAAIVEDETDALTVLIDCCNRYSTTHEIEIRIKHFGNAADFLEKYSANFDVVFMDIKLPGLNGMDAARRLRAIDGTVTLLFVTSMRQFAVEGYEVNALDFIVKPVTYKNFEPKFDRVAEHIRMQTRDTLSIVTRQGVTMLDTAKLIYVEVRDHELVFHTTEGDIATHGSLNKIEQELKISQFVRCNNYLLVNPRFVSSIDSVKLITTVGGHELKISYGKRVEYRNAVMQYLERCT